MRIIAGRLGGRQFIAPSGHRTHPMSDRARGGLFNSLGDVSGLTFLDAFAGSGALSFEALSRGARHVTAIDNDRRAIETIKKNAKNLGVEPDLKIIHANVSGWMENNPGKVFDIVIAAPPYGNLQYQIVEKSAIHVTPDGLFVLDWPGNASAPSFAGYKTVAQKKYGDAQIVFYRMR